MLLRAVNFQSCHQRVPKQSMLMYGSKNNARKGFNVNSDHCRAMNCKIINPDVLTVEGFLSRGEVLTLYPSSMLSFYYA